MPHYFDPTILREYDIRGIVGETLSAADARAIGRAYAVTLGETVDQCLFQLGRGQPAVIADRDAVLAGGGEGRREGATDRMGIGRKQGFADDAANVVFAQDRRVEAMRHRHPR